MAKSAPRPKINPELKDFLDQPNDELLEQMQNKIKAEGVLDPIRVAEDGDTVDGHSRLEVYETLKIRKYPIAVIRGLKTIADKKKWMLDNQLARRNLTPTRRAYYLGLKFEEEKKPEGNPTNSVTVTELPGDTAERIAEQAGVSPSTVEKAAAFARAVQQQPDAVKPAILAGEVPMRTVVAAASEGKSAFCKKCRDFGYKKGCEYCAKIRAELKNKPAPKADAAKKGAPLIDWPKFEAAMGVVTRLSDRIAEHYKDTAEKKEYDRHIAEIVRIKNVWRGRHNK